jgi:DNA repair protein RadA/Sms
MTKSKTVFVCQNCGNIAPKWEGKCSACNSWNTYIEEILDTPKQNKNQHKVSFKSEPRLINSIAKVDFERIQLPYSELNRVLGGGLVPGSLTLMGGEPGIGKSTLILQAALNIRKKILYVSGEESEGQIKMRADRIGINNEDCLIYTETIIEKIIAVLENNKPDIVIIDSIQTVFSEDLSSSAGTISQIRESARQLQAFAKSKNIPVILIGHINKEGEIAGPMVLEHIVDTVLQFEGDNNHFYRLLRPKKNRFGSTYEIGVFEMRADGLKEISDPGNILLSDEHSALSGVSYGTLGEGNRTLMLEVQALTSASVYSSPQRSATGFDNRRFQMLLAVIEKRLGIRLAQKDIFLNIAGGIKVNDPAVDLSVVAAVISSYFDKIIAEGTCFIGEVGLSGQIRPVSYIDKRISEAARLGFKNIFIASGQKPESKHNAKIISVSDVKNFSSKLFKQQ